MYDTLITLAQNNSSGGAGAAAGGGLILLIQLAIIVVVIAGLWKVYAKAGQPGWAAIVPIYNLYIWTKIVGRPWWWLLLMLIPFVNFIVAIVLWWDLARSFGKSVLFTLGLIFLSPIFVCILGFGADQYQGPAAAGAAVPKLT